MRNRGPKRRADQDLSAAQNETISHFKRSPHSAFLRYCDRNITPGRVYRGACPASQVPKQSFQFDCLPAVEATQFRKLLVLVAVQRPEKDWQLVDRLQKMQAFVEHDALGPPSDHKR